MLWRLLFPSWAFFDAITEVPRLETRWLTDDGAAGPWTSALEAPARGRWSVVYHPRGTAHLALQSIVDRFAVEEESGEHDDVTAALVAAVAARRCREQLSQRAAGARAADAMWQWRVVAVDVLRPDEMRTIHESLPKAFPG